MNRILSGILITFIVCCSGLCFASEKQNEREPQNSQDQSGEAKKVTKKLGPFEIGKKRFVIIEDVTEREGNVISCNSFEIRDEAGVSHYQKTLGPFIDSSTVIEGIYKLEGKSGEGLIIYFDTGPNAPPAGKSFQVFGVEKGKVKPLSQPINVYGQIQSLPKGKSQGSIRLFDRDLIQVEVWKDFYGIIIPLVVDFKKLAIMPIKKEGFFDISTTPGQPHTSFGHPIKFYGDHNVNAKVILVIATDVKKVKFLNAYANVQLEKQSGNQILDIDVSNIWLAVKINGKDGWVNDIEDFFTLGLTPSG